ncbi:hypothetical protein EON67_11875 [archaeon]|nr:MAG: hypothetical protein EON67_11875 [archaeon]
MSESEGSASSSLPYESLLAHTAQLQGDLHAAVGACKALKVHNDALRSAYEKVRSRNQRVSVRWLRTRCARGLA